MINTAIDVESLNIDKNKSYINPHSQLDPPSERDAAWYYHQGRYISSFYNQPVGRTTWPLDSDLTRTTDPKDRNLKPASEMIRMMLYYQGRQPNIDYSFVQSDATSQTMQAMWTKSQDVKEFVDYFKGSMLSQLQNAEFSAKPLSRKASYQKANMYDKAMLAFELKPFLKQMAEQQGVSFDPTGGKEFELPEEVQRWMETDWKEEGSEVYTYLANGLWQSDRWLQKSLQMFMHMIQTSLCGFHHYTQNGRYTSEVLMPYQIINDNRIDDDYGYYDEFKGMIGALTPKQLKVRFPGLTDAQVKILEDIADNKEIWSNYNVIGNPFTWFNDTGLRGTVTFTTCYFRTKGFVPIKYVEKDGVFPRYAKVDNLQEGQIFDDISAVTIIGNKFVIPHGPIDNLVEEVGRPDRPMMPIQTFRPNTFMGDSISEVKRISRIVDEIDYYEYKIKEAIGKAKGKVYIFWSDLFKGGDGPKELMEELESLGFSVRSRESGEDDGELNRKNSQELVSELDFTMDPNVFRLAELIRSKKETMRSLMSTSDIALGQRRSYIGNNTAQTAISQNSVGTAYLFDGFMDFLVHNMRYAANFVKNQMALLGEEKEREMLIGDRGLVFIKLLKDSAFEQVFIKLDINDVIDDRQKQRLLTIAQAAAQNQQLEFIDYVSIEKSRTLTEIENSLDYALKKRNREMQKQSQIQQQMQAQNDQVIKQMEMMMMQFKESNANYRKELEAVLKTTIADIQQAQKALEPQPLIPDQQNNMPQQ